MKTLKYIGIIFIILAIIIGLIFSIIEVFHKPYSSKNNNADNSFDQKNINSFLGKLVSPNDLKSSLYLDDNMNWNIDLTTYKIDFINTFFHNYDYELKNWQYQYTFIFKSFAFNFTLSSTYLSVQNIIWYTYNKNNIVLTNYCAFLISWK